MIETLKPSVLVTGGAGYIGSHAVLALKDAGWPVAVIDNLSTGFRFAVDDDVSFYEGDIEDSDLLARIFAEQGTRAIMHFAGSIIVPESVEDPLKYYHNNTVKSRALIAAAVAASVRPVARAGVERDPQGHQRGARVPDWREDEAAGARRAGDARL